LLEAGSISLNKIIGGEEMKKILFLLVTLALIVPAISQAQDSQETDIHERIRVLEAQLEQLTAEPVKKTVVKSKYPVDIYGFIAAQFSWGDSTTGTFTTAVNAGGTSAVAQSYVANERINPRDDGWFAATPQNSRIGFLWTGSNVSKNLILGGRLEIDFLNPGGGMSPRPRIRHAYLDLGTDKWSLIAGQNWDLFSPLNTRSLSLGNNVWYQGNLGFRRPQLRFTYNFIFTEKDSLKAAISVNNPGNFDTLINSGNTTGVPYGEGLLEYTREMKAGNLVIGASGVYGKDRSGNRWSNVWGIAGSLIVPFHKFLQLNGEIHYGENLGAFLTYANTNNRVHNLAGWGEISSRWCKYFETNIGFGIDDLQDSRVAAGTAVANIDRNQIIYGNFKIYPFKSFYIGLEYENIRTRYQANGTSTANVVFTNLVYSF